VWTADGLVSERWLPITPDGRLDGFEWKLPLAELGGTPSVIEAAAPAQVSPAESVSDVSVRETETPVPDAASAARPRSRKTVKAADKPKTVEPVIPLVHAPDDPGPDGVGDAEPVPEHTTAGGDAWQRIRGLFR
jgi:HemY protein